MACVGPDAEAARARQSGIGRERADVTRSDLDRTRLIDAHRARAVGRADRRQPHSGTVAPGDELACDRYARLARMHLRVVGAGLGRTGTLSLKTAIERLLGGNCYHMVEVFGHPEHAQIWQSAADGRAVDWDAVLGDYNATVDWPTSAFWRELAAANPDAIILLSTRDSPQTWWKSTSQTIFVGMDNPAREPVPGWRAMWDAVSGRTMAAGFHSNADIAVAGYEAHNAAVRATADPSRLVQWEPGDGWAPLCAALDVAIPDEPFPHLNTSEEWAAHRAQTNAAGGGASPG